MTFGQKITYIRKQKKWSQNQLGKEANVSGDIVGKYERDEMKPSIETARKLAKALEVTLDFLVGDEDMQIIDKKMIKRLQAINNMPKEVKEKVLFFIDMSIRDFGAKKAYAS